MRPIVAAFFSCLFVLGMAAPAQAEDGVVVYAVGNCFIMLTEEGHTLFERSGGAVPEEGQAVTGVLHDFGYQQIFDDQGAELFVGWIQNWGVKPGVEIDDFKENCR